MGQACWLATAVNQQNNYTGNMKFFMGGDRLGAHHLGSSNPIAWSRKMRVMTA
jgi:hypothetical protein